MLSLASKLNLISSRHRKVPPTLTLRLAKGMHIGFHRFISIDKVSYASAPNLSVKSMIDLANCMTIKPNRPVPKIHNARCTVAFFTEPYAVSPVVCSRSNSDAINISNIYKRIAYPLVIDYMFCNLIFICEWCDHNDEWYLTINPETNNNSNNDYKTREIIFLTSNSNLRYPVLLLPLYVPFVKMIK
jgi:hypothetical protein